MKVWLEKERSLCHHVDKMDLVEEFMDQCVDEVEAASAELQRRSEVAEEKTVEGKNDKGKKDKDKQDEAKQDESNMRRMVKERI